jgi:hypothetical protein
MSKLAKLRRAHKCNALKLFHFCITGNPPNLLRNVDTTQQLQRGGMQILSEESEPLIYIPRPIQLEFTVVHHILLRP